MYATAFGSDGLAGDTSFHPQHFEASADDTFNTLLEKWKVVYAKEYFGPEGKPEMLTPEVLDEECIELPVGFWVYDEPTKTAVESVCESDPGCDSALYAMIHSCKLIMSRCGKEIRP